MNYIPVQRPTARRFARIALLVAALGVAARVVHLAIAPASDPRMPPYTSDVAARTRDVPGDTLASTAARDAELAELYQACPLAAVFDLKYVADSPEKIDAILPPFRQTAERTPHTELPASPPLEPAVPRIRYPVHVAARPDTPGEKHLRLDELAKSEHSSHSPAGDNDKRVGEWLIDPREWFETGENQPAQPAATGNAAPGSTKDVKGAANADDPRPALPQPAAAEPSTSRAPPVTPAPPVETNPVPKSSETDSARPASAKPLFAPPVAPPSAGSDDSVEHQPSSVGNQAQAIDQSPPAGPRAAPPDQPPSTIVAPPHTPGAPPTPEKLPGPPPAVDPHLELYTKSAYPSARECAACHEEIYEQWSMSAHAYAAVSPMFNKFEQKLNDLSQGTVGYFCIRCHAPVATSLCASRDTPLWQLPEAAREGITCVACHRVQYAYGKSNGERRIETADIFGPVFGGIGGDGVAEVSDRKDEFKVKTDPNDKGPGQNIHVTGVYFQPLTRSEFCTPCHQVAVHPGIKLEVVWEQYRASPACKKGIQCQDCHMGRVPGLPLGYDCGPVAKVAGKTVNDNRRKSNHVFFGPNYPIAHPGVFPFNLKASRWTMDQWLTFDWRAGWGTREFEDAVADGRIKCEFPPVWAEADDRLDAREIVEANLKKMELKRELRVQVMENGSRVEGPFFDSALCRNEDIHFHYIVTNTNDGHNLLTASLGAQPQLWANVVLIGPDGARLWESGYTDSAGDLANIHSYDVRHKRLAYDWQLFNLQTMFLIQGVKGTDREFYVPVNFDIDQLPFIRPGTQPITVLNHPPTIRMESQSLAPLGSRKVPYRIPRHLVQRPGTYRLSFRMRSRSEPIYFMRFCEATEEMERSMNEWMIDVHPMSVTFEVK